MPLENVTIKLQNQTVTTDKNGKAYLEGIATDYYSEEPIEFSTLNDTLSISKRVLNNVYGYYNQEEKNRGTVQLIV